MKSSTHSSSNHTSQYTDPLLTQPNPNQPVVVLLPTYTHHHHRLLNKSYQRGLICCATFLIFLIAAAYLLWPSDPHLSIVRLKLENITFHTKSTISIDLTLDLTVKVRNRDFYSIDYDTLTVGIGYRGKDLGTVTSESGHIVPRGSVYVDARVELVGVEVSDLVLLIKDLANGAVTFDVVSDMEGRLGLYLFDLPLKTKISCEVIVNTRTEKMSRQNCYPEVSELR